MEYSITLVNGSQEKQTWTTNLAGENETEGLDAGATLNNRFNGDISKEEFQASLTLQQGASDVIVETAIRYRQTATPQWVLVPPISELVLEQKFALAKTLITLTANL